MWWRAKRVPGIVVAGENYRVHCFVPALGTSTSSTARFMFPSSLFPRFAKVRARTDADSTLPWIIFAPSRKIARRPYYSARSPLSISIYRYLSRAIRLIEVWLPATENGTLSSPLLCHLLIYDVSDMQISRIKLVRLSSSTSYPGSSLLRCLKKSLVSKKRKE